MTKTFPVLAQQRPLQRCSRQSRSGLCIRKRCSNPRLVAGGRQQQSREKSPCGDCRGSWIAGCQTRRKEIRRTGFALHAATGRQRAMNSPDGMKRCSQLFGSAGTLIPVIFSVASLRAHRRSLRTRVAVHSNANVMETGDELQGKTAGKTNLQHARMTGHHSASSA